MYSNKHANLMDVRDVLIAILHGLVQIVCPIITALLIDGILSKEYWDRIMQVMILFVSIYLMDPLLGIVRERLILNRSEKYASINRGIIYSHVIKSDYESFERIKIGDILSLLSNDAKEEGRFRGNYLSKIIVDFVVIIGIIVFMVLISVKISSIILTVFFISLIINNDLSNKINRESEKLQKELDKYYDVGVKSNPILSL